MLGLVGGYFSGRYIGVAPGAQFIVAKTENPDSLYEYPVEEDTYIAGLEWCEAQGADIVSSSLGYSEWYSWRRDYDGRTSPASIAAYEATRRGMVVVTAAGNVSIPRLEIPGDAIDVITVGGIDTLYNRWEFSGYGPTEEGRIKPELVCLSAAPVVLNPDSSDSSLYSFGTSGATAIVTGICALRLEAHPNWNVDSVRNALFTTASFADQPTDSMGFGWPDAYAAITLSPIQTDTMRGSGWLTPYPNPFILSIHNNIYVPFKLDRESAVEVKVYLSLIHI
jgi:subtilisin family serine protease